MNSNGLESEMEIDCTPPEVLAMENLLPAKSKDRLKFRNSCRVMVRALSDKTPKNDEQLSEVTDNAKKISNDEESKIYTDKIKSLLKSMADNQHVKCESEFTVAPILNKKKKPNPYNIKTINKNIEKEITTAAADVATAIGGDVKQTESELLSKVLGKVTQTPTDLSQLLVGMKVNRTSKESDDEYESRGERVKRLVSMTRSTPPRSRPMQHKFRREEPSRLHVTRVNLFSGEPTGVFKNATGTVNYGIKLDLWEELEKRELALATAQPPANYFQKMILWTEQGKIWKFPINNEQGLEEENNIHFSEHVLLDSQLEGWCPHKGPIRHFMDLVCSGLAKNPFYTAQEKKEHILWYREYFESKKDLLVEVGAWNVDNIPKEDNTNV